MAEKPILFNTEMVMAILDGRKTQTRRVAFPERDLREFRNQMYPDGWWYRGRVFQNFKSFLYDPNVPKCKYWPGNVLWVRETWAEMPYGYVYRADDEEPEGWDPDDRWCPSIHMPREAARIFLKVTDVRLERLQDIDDEGAKAEGANFGAGVAEKMRRSAIERFAEIWDSTIKPSDRERYGWDANPWVWVIKFKRIEEPERRWNHG